MNTKIKLFKSLGVATATSLLAIMLQTTSVDAASAKNIRIRISHAKELLGKNYKRSVVRKSELSDDLSGFVTAATKRFLPKFYKKDSSKISSTIMAEADRYGFDPIFLMAVIQNESSFNPKRKGGAGEIGLMQIKPSTAEWIAKTYKIEYSDANTLYDPQMNIRIGAAFIHKLRTQFESKSRLYLSAYNIGAKKVRSLVLGKKAPKEYVLAVMKRYIAIYSGFGTGKDHQKQGQLAWLKVSNITSSNTSQVVAN